MAVAIVVFFVWRFWIKKKREQMDSEEWEEEDDGIAQQKGGDERRFTAMHHHSRADAASTRTRGSVAQSFLSRASNIIQIAYIPGVTNRNNSNHTSVHGDAPVPPIPAARGNMPRSPLSNNGEALFFRPGDLRDSSYSDTGSIASNNRDTQYRQSITPSLARSSVASTIYRDDGSSEPMPATQVQRLAPRMVSINSPQSGGSPAETPGSETPPKSAPGNGNGVQVMMPGQSSSTSSPQGSIRSYARPTQVTVGKGRIPVRQPSDTASTRSKKHMPNVSSPLAEADASDEDDNEDERERATQSLYGSDTSQPAESPFFDESERPPPLNPQRPNPYARMGANIGTSGNDSPEKRGGKGMGGLSAVIEEATKRASSVPSHEGLGGRRDRSPFGDEHSTS